MSKAETDPRVKKAKERLASARAKFEVAESDFLDACGEVLRERGIDPSNVVVPKTWDCNKSPVGTCVYDFFQDPCRDSCLFCGDPEERK